jgi:hypothetical protein
MYPGGRATVALVARGVCPKTGEPSTTLGDPLIERFAPLLFLPPRAFVLLMTGGGVGAITGAGASTVFVAVPLVLFVPLGRPLLRFVVPKLVDESSSSSSLVSPPLPMPSKLTKVLLPAAEVGFNFSATVVRVVRMGIA